MASSDRLADAPRMRRWRVAGQVFLVVAVLGIFAVHVASFWTFLSDDALISLRYARRLLQGQGLTWTDGERVEGYTDLLWVLLGAAGRAFGFDLVATVRALGVVGGLLAIVSVSASTSGRLVNARLASGGLALALCPPLAAWAAGGLEHGFMAGVLAVALLAVARVVETEGQRRHPLVVAGAAFGALALLRADGIVLVAFALLGALGASKRGWRSVRSMATMASIPIALLAAQMVFRTSYYGELVPNTALAKVALTMHRVRGGVEHVVRGHASVWPMYAVVLPALVVGARRMRRERWLPAASVLVGWSTYLAVVGGDIFPAWRQLLFAFIALAALVAEAVEAAAGQLSAHAVRTMGAAIPALALGLVSLESVDFENQRARQERWEWAGYSVGTLLRDAFASRKPLLAVDAAGALPYWSELPSLDMLGLNDAYIAHHPPPSFGHGGMVGHELGDGAYVLGRRPDIVAFANAAGTLAPSFLSGRQMVDTPEFESRYQLVRVRGTRGNRAIGLLYLRREDGRLGVVRSDDAVVIPGYFFASDNALAEPDERGRLVTIVLPGGLAEVPDLSMSEGTYRLEVDSVGAPIRLGFRCGDGSAQRLLEHGTTLEIPMPMRVNIDVAVDGDASAALRMARFVRTSEPPAFRCYERRGRVEIPSDRILRVKAERTHYADPDNLVFGPLGIRIRLGGRSNVHGIEISVDNQDHYELWFMDGDERVAETHVRARDIGGGLAVHRLEVPPAARERGFDSILIDARGDGTYAIGHIRGLAPDERVDR